MSYQSADDTTYYYYSYRPSCSSHPPSSTCSSAGRLSRELVVALAGLVVSSLVIIVTWIALFGRPRSSTVLYFIEGFVGDNWIAAMVIKWAGAVDWTRIGAGLAIDPAADDDGEHSGEHCPFPHSLIPKREVLTQQRLHAGAVQAALPSSSGFAAGSSAHLLPLASGDPSGTHYPGLLNAAGNLCFLNATLQSIASITPLLYYLESLPSGSTSHSPNSVILTLRRTLHALNSPCIMRPPPLRPTALAQALAASSPTRRSLLASRDQQDAHELLGMIREAVEEEVVKIARREARKNESPGLGALLRFGESDQGKGRKGGGDVSGKGDPWLLLTSQRVQCLTCAYTRDVRHTSDQQVELQVPDRDRCSLYQLLEEWTKLDLLSDYACRKCCLAATLTKLEEQRDRLALVDSVTTLTNTPSASAEANLNGSTSNPVGKSSKANAFDPLLDPAASPTTTDAARAPVPKMTSSRANRRRKVQKTINQIKEAWDAGDYEREFGNELKVEKVFGPAGKLVRFARTPEILTFHLSRSSHYATGGGLAVKNQCRVDFPEYLDVTPFSNDPAFTTNAPSSAELLLGERSHKDFYRLASVVVHHGTHSYGHYVAFRRRPVLPPHLRQHDQTQTQDEGGSRASDLDAVEAAEPNDELGPQPKRLLREENRAEWYHISDETVHSASIQHVLAGNPFLLFYERVKQDHDGAVEGSRIMQAGKGKGKKVDWKFEGMQLGEIAGAEAEGKTPRAFGEPRVLRRWELASSLSSRTETTGGGEGASG